MKNFTAFRSMENLQKINSTGVLIGFDLKGFGERLGDSLVYPYIIISLCTSGSCRARYDMKEVRMEKNDLFLALPGHIMQPLEYSDDFQHTWLIFDPTKFAYSDLKFSSTDLELLTQAPRCRITAEQAASLLNAVKTVEYIMTRKEEDLPNKHYLLEMQLTVGYELYMAMRHENDQTWQKNPMGHIFLTFCNLVVAHYKEERNVNYYADVLDYDARYFTKIFRAYSNGVSPLEWIQNYIATKAKKIMDENPKMTVKQVGIELGFPISANFCRYFKRAAGLYPKEYKEMNKLRIEN